MIHKSFGFGIVALYLSAPLLSADEERLERCLPVEVTAVDGENENRGRRHRRRRVPEFSAAEILDLELGVDLPRRLRESRTVELDVYTAKGHLYQTLKLDVPREEEPTDRRRWWRRYRRVELDATLPVAGTSIVTSSLYGVWSVEVRVDGEQERCARPSRFEITP